MVSCKTSSRITCDRKNKRGRTSRPYILKKPGKLAAYYSSMRGSEKVEIDYIEKKHIKKPKGAKPGFVVYYTNYSLVIDSDIRGIQKNIRQLELAKESLFSLPGFSLLKHHKASNMPKNTDTCLTPFIVLNSVP